MANWWIHRAGRISGPYSQDEVKHDCRNGKLTRVDLAVRQGDSQWRLLAQIEEFANVFSAPDVGFDSAADARGEWVIARPNRSGAELSGPYHTQTVKQKIAAGVFRFSDLAWREGTQGWIPLNTCPEFDRESAPLLSNTSSEAMDEDSSDFQIIDAHTLLKSLNPTKTDHHPDLRVPEEAAGGDLLETPPWMKALSGAIGALVVTFGGFMAQGADHLEIVALKTTGAKPALVFETDAAVGEKIQVTIKGESGQILQLPSVTRNLTVSRESGELPSLDLASLRLPKGSYEIEASSSGGLRSKKTIFLGQQDAEFNKQLEAHRKRISAQQQEEKFALFYLAKEFGELARELQRSFKTNRRQRQGSPRENTWKSFYSAWQVKMNRSSESLREFTNRSVETLAYPQAIADLATSVERLRTGAQELDAAIAQKREIASEQAPSVFEADFKSAMKRAGYLTSYPTLSPAISK